MTEKEKPFSYAKKQTNKQNARFNLSFILLIKKTYSQQSVSKIFTYRSDVRRIWVLQNPVHLLDSQLHSEELVEQAKCSGGSTAIPGHPRLHVIDLVVDLVDHFMVCLQPVKLFEIVRRQNIHAKNPLKQRFDRFPTSLDLHIHTNNSYVNPLVQLIYLVVSKHGFHIQTSLSYNTQKQNSLGFSKIL